MTKVVWTDFKSDHSDTRQHWHILFRYGWYILFRYGWYIPLCYRWLISFRYDWHISFRCGWHIDSVAIRYLPRSGKYGKGLRPQGVRGNPIPPY